jgi:hypothetical protein
MKTLYSVVPLTWSFFRVLSGDTTIRHPSSPARRAVIAVTMKINDLPAPVRATTKTSSPCIGFRPACICQSRGIFPVWFWTANATSASVTTCLHRGQGVGLFSCRISVSVRIAAGDLCFCSVSCSTFIMLSRGGLAPRTGVNGQEATLPQDRLAVTHEP